MNIIFMGRKNYAAKMLKWTVEQGINVVYVCTDTQNPDSSTKRMADALNVPIASIGKIEQYVQEHPESIDLVVSYLYWRKIRKTLITLPRYGCINFHPAILPDWRGCGGYNIAILNQLSTWGATAHYVDENIDTGDVIRIYKFNFDYRLETAYSLEKKTQNIQMSLYKSVILDVLKHGKLKVTVQDKVQGCYISKQEMIRMMKIDIDNISAKELDNKIRAFWFPPYNGAGFEIDGKFYTLINEEILHTLQDNVIE